MRKKNRLINDFRKQNRCSIWKHMEAMAMNYAVYSNHLTGLAPYLTENDVYIYVDSENLVVVCVDSYKRHEMPTYEESESFEAMIYHHGSEPRESLVWKLKETMRMMKRRLYACNFDFNVYGVLLTEAKIINVEDLEEMWEANNIKVIEGFRDLKHRTVSVNADEELSVKIYYGAAIDSDLDADAESVEMPEKKDVTKEDLDEFEKMLNEFIYGDLKAEVVEDENGIDQVPSDDNEVDHVDEESPDEKSETNMEDVEIPSGEIEQNQTLSVGVKILSPIAHPREELDKLVGCDDIKHRMDELVALTRYNQLVSEAFPKSKRHEVSLHSVFLGRPGTGKTTVCKIFGSLLRQAGALSKGHVVVCDRGTFIGTLWGDEERSVRQVLEKAKGGVLMIDEAYLLCSKNENDPGRLVVPLLMSILADETQRDIAVVLCGYKDQMQKLLDTNPGLQSRFPNKFEFQDFTIDELLEITRHRVLDYEYQFTDEAWKKYRTILTQAYQMRDPQVWGNARFVANLLERIYIQHATRCVKQPPTDKLKLKQITPEDIVPIEIPRPKAKMGF